MYRCADKSLARPGRKQARATEDFDVHISYYNHNWRNISTICITRLASNEIFSPSNKIHREVGRAKDLSARRYLVQSTDHEPTHYVIFSGLLLFPSLLATNI